MIANKSAAFPSGWKKKYNSSISNKNNNNNNNNKNNNNNNIPWPRTTELKTGPITTNFPSNNFIPLCSFKSRVRVNVFDFIGS